MALPRLTGTLRAFSGLSADDGEGGASGSHPQEELHLKRRQRAEELAKHGLSWNELCETFRKRAKGVPETEINKSLRELVHICREIVGEESSPEYVEEGAALAFVTFMHSRHVTNAATIKLRGIFGPFPASAATKACHLVNHMLLWLPEHIAESLSMESDTSPSPSTDASSASSTAGAKPKEFGTGIKFMDDVGDIDLEPEHWLGSDYSDDEGDDSFDMRYENLPQAEGGAGGMDAGWLKREVEKAFAGSNMGLPLMDMCRGIFDVLCSPKSDSELQNDLFELLGFDRFELIEQLLSKRHDLISVTFETATEIAVSKASALRAKEETRPNYGCQVTIQSEQEKQMRKQYKKEKSTDCDSA